MASMGTFRDMTTVRKLRRLSYWAPLRFTVQAAAAAILTFAIVQIFGMDEVQWAVVSALFAVQWSLDSSIGIAVGRILGATVGSFLGMACVLLIGTEGTETIISLSIAVALMSFIAGLWPGLYYGLFAAAAMILDPGGADVAETAVERAIAISLGTAVGALSATLLLPVPAHRNAEEHLGRAVRRCGDLLVENVNALVGESHDLGHIHQDIRGKLYRAQTMVAESKYARRIDRRINRPSPEPLLRSVQRLWHSFSLIDRVEEKQLPEKTPSRLTSDLKETAEAGRQYLHHLGHAIEDNTPAQSPQDVLHRFDSTIKALEAACMGTDGGSYTPGEAERFNTLAIVLVEVRRHIEDMLKSLGADPKRGEEDQESAQGKEGEEGKEEQARPAE